MFSSEIASVVDYINQNHTFIVITHEGPDGDTVSSALALSSFLRRLNKKVFPVSAGPFNRDEIKLYENKFDSELPFFTDSTGIGSIIVDCSSIKRTGFSSLPSSTFKVIDHHAVTENDSGEGFIDILSPSTTLLIAQLIDAYGLSYTEEEACYMLLGFCTDTGFFRHLQSTSSGYLWWVSKLMDAGASPTKIFDTMQGSYSLDSRRYTGKLLQQSESYFDGKLLLICEDSTSKLNDGDPVDRDSDTIYRLLLSVGGVEVVGILKQSERGVSGGLRSKNVVNVANIAASFGGGGHAKAAGFLQKDRLLNVKQKLLDDFKAVIYQK